jgi:hypothetical protein
VGSFIFFLLYLVINVKDKAQSACALTACPTGEASGEMSKRSEAKSSEWMDIF